MKKHDDDGVVDTQMLEKEVKKLMKEKNDLVSLLEAKEHKISQLDPLVNCFVEEMKGAPDAARLAEQLEKTLNACEALRIEKFHL